MKKKREVLFPYGDEMRLQFRKMKLTAILLFIVCVTFGNSFSQVRLTVRFEKADVRDVMQTIEEKTNYIFLYKDQIFDFSQKVSIDLIDAKFEDVLKSLCDQTNVSYEVRERQIILKEKDFTVSNGIQQQKPISGKVTDTFGVPLPGVSVVIKGTTNGTITDANGIYSLSGIPANAILQFSFVGMKGHEVTVGNKTSINVVLEEETIGIEEVVAIGYGSVGKKELTSAVSHISSKDFLKVSSVDPSMMIQGKVSGVSITNTAAADPNNQASIQIRGITSRAAGLGPLVVIDGVPGGNLTNINTNDIESMDILKDGAASAIYGTRGSNGVILVTTKKGSKDGTIHTTYNSMISASIPYNELDLLSAADYRKYRTASNPALDLGSNTDWIDKITRTGFTQQQTLTLSAGNNKSNYRASADYRDASGIDIRSGREEYGGRVSINHATNSGLLKHLAKYCSPCCVQEEFIS